MLTPIPPSGHFVEEQNPTTPIRSVSLPGDYIDSMIGYGGASAGKGLPSGQNQFRSPLHWPLPTSPIHSYPGLGGSRTPVRSFDTCIPGEGFDSIGQFDFGADGELVLYSVGGNSKQPTPSGTKIDDAIPSHIKETLESASLQLGMSGMDSNILEQKMLSLSRKIATNAAVPMLNVPADHIDNLTPMNEAGNAVIKSTVHPVQQKTLTEGGRCRSKSVNFEKLPKSLGLLKRDDMGSAAPEQRFQKIQSLYAELQKLQEVGYQLQASIRHRDGQIASQAKDNASLWSMAAHVGSAIQLALDEEAKAIQIKKTPSRQAKRRRSSTGVEENPSKCLRTPNMTKVNTQQLLELEELFHSPRSGDIFATCDIFMSPLGYGNMALNSGMYPIPTPLQHKNTFSSLMSPMPLGSFNGPAVSFAVDDQLDLKTRGEGPIDKENSFSFQNL